MDDDNFIDDTGVEPADGYGSGNEPHSPGEAPQVNFPFFFFFFCIYIFIYIFTFQVKYG